MKFDGQGHASKFMVAGEIRLWSGNADRGVATESSFRSFVLQFTLYFVIVL